MAYFILILGVTRIKVDLLDSGGASGGGQSGNWLNVPIMLPNKPYRIAVSGGGSGGSPHNSSEPDRCDER